MSEYLLEAKNVHKSFAGVNALKGVDLQIKKGEIHCLAGENGCGKSTLIKIISGVYTMDEGQIIFDGVPYDKISPSQAIANGVQVIYQDFSIFPNLSVMENIAVNSALSQKKKFADWRAFRKIAVKALGQIGVQIDLDAKVGDLPVADKQLIAISRALINNAKLIIMDEPTTALTKKEISALFKLMLELKAQGISLLFVSHKLDEVFEISDRYTIFRSGERISTGNTQELNHEQFTYYMTGRNFSDQRYLPEKRQEPPVLEVENLSLKNGFYNISFTLSPGEILGITGLLGSGRTELALSLFGAQKADSGTVKIRGQTRNITSIQEAIRCQIGYVPEDRLKEGLFLSQSITNNIVVSKWDELAKGHGLLDRKKDKAEAAKWISDLSIATSDPEHAVMTLSGGNQQRVVLAKWLALNLDILILNGPTVGVDIGSKHDIHATLRSLAQSGLAIIIISDDLTEVLQNCSRILVMKTGRIVAEKLPEEITAEELAGILASDAVVQEAQA